MIRALAIGTSAGGVDALLRLLPALPAAADYTVLVVLHRPPQPDSGLAALLATRCALPLDDAWDREPLRGGRVLLAPPDYHLLVDTAPPAGPGGDTAAARAVASLSVDAPVLFSRPAIDPLFESAARVFGPALLALVLTGASRDGAEGARAVRRAGGRLWVQSPDDAAAPTMPRAALALAGGADAVIDLEAMAQRLAAGRLVEED